MGLEPLNCYIRLTGNYPITQISFEYQHRQKMQEAFVSRLHSNDVLFTEVASLVEQFEAPYLSAESEDKEKNSAPEKNELKTIDM